MLQTTHPDDFSFSPSPSVTNGGYSGLVGAYSDYRDNPIDNSPSMNDESPFSSKPWSKDEDRISSVFPDSGPPNASLNLAPKSATSYTDELNSLPKQHVFAPPGKIGVAIDVVNGQPVVHKVRKNSPLENMLQSNDIIMAIDDEDACGMSAADVTSLMVKRMDRVRKITFVRRNG